MDKYRNELEQRAGEHRWELSFMTGYKGDGWAKAQEVSVEETERKRGVRLYAIEGWKKYSRNQSYFTSHRYLAGIDSGEYWAVRLPGNINNISDGFAWLTPAAVTRAISKSKWVTRQGDVYFIQSTRDNLTDLPESHEYYRAARRIFLHGEHKSVKVPDHVKGVKVVRQKQMASTGRTYAD